MHDKEVLERKYPVTSGLDRCGSFRLWRCASYSNTRNLVRTLEENIGGQFAFDWLDAVHRTHSDCPI